MFKLFLPNQIVPSWLQRVTINVVEDKSSLMFTNITAVYIKHGSYSIKPLIGPSVGGSILHMADRDYSKDTIVIEGQKPYKDSGDVVLDCNPLFSYSELVMAALFGISFYLFLV